MESKRIFLAGIGGIGVSGLARFLKKEGNCVFGWDLNENSLIKELRDEGIIVNTGEKAPALNEDIDLFIHSHAVKKNHPVILDAIERNIPLFERGEYLAKILSERFSIAVTGSHGKTTVTFMAAHLLNINGFEPTVYGGGIDKDKKSNFILGNDDLIVAEMDESDKTFAKSSPMITIFTNLDYEHVNEYKSYEELTATTKQFFTGLGKDSILIINGDDKDLKRLADENFNGRELISCGYGPENNFIISKTECRVDEVQFSVEEKGQVYNGIVSGFIRHNVQNLVMAGCAVMRSKHFKSNKAFDGSSFKGVKRRFEYLQQANENRGFLVSDYGHHPEEIASVLISVKKNVTDRNIAVVFEPHRLSRLKMFLEEFKRALRLADVVFLADLHRAGEDGDYEEVYQEIIKAGNNNIYRMHNCDLKETTDEILGKGYHIIIFSAGKIDALFRELYSG